MRHVSACLIFAASSMFGTSGCATTTGTERTGGDRGFAQNAAEARGQLDAVIARNPDLQVDTRAPTSLAEAVEVLRQDAFFRFDATSDYLTNQPGVDALSLRALTEYAAADVLQSAANLVEQKEKRDRDALEVLERQRQAGAATADADTHGTELRERADARARTVRALRILFQYHADLAARLATQAMTMYPDDAGGHLVMAGVARLHRDWNEFDLRIRRAEELRPDAPLVEYMHAMERSERFADPEGAEQRLRDVLARNPELVRARAKLLLLAGGIDQAHAELKALEALSPHHLFVAILGRDIEQEYRVASEIRAAVAQPAAEPAAPAAVTPEPAAPAAPAP